MGLFMGLEERINPILEKDSRGEKLTTRDLLVLLSRSFSIPVRLLSVVRGEKESEKEAEVENFYELARYIDTIEDSHHDVNEKSDMMEDFFEILRKGYSKRGKEKMGLSNLTMRLLTPPSKGKAPITPNEAIFVKHFDSVLEKYQSFKKNIRDLVPRWLGDMAYGMIQFQNKEIETFEDLDKYCYEVAGTVGCLLTEIVWEKDKLHGKTKNGVIMNNLPLPVNKAIAFGRFLQKINIIKDFREDAEDEKYFWPHELYGTRDPHEFLDPPWHAFKTKRLMRDGLDKMIVSAREDSKSAFEYILSVPESLSGYRSFCLVPALMASETLKLMEENPKIFSEKEGLKMSTSTFGKILYHTALSGKCDNSWIENYGKNPNEFSFIKDYEVGDKEMIKLASFYKKLEKGD